MTEGSFHRRRSTPSGWLGRHWPWRSAAAPGSGTTVHFPAPRHPLRPRQQHLRHHRSRSAIRCAAIWSNGMNSPDSSARSITWKSGPRPGYLQSIHFQDGQIVQKGALLFVIDPRPYEAALASAAAHSCPVQRPARSRQPATRARRSAPPARCRCRPAPMISVSGMRSPLSGVEVSKAASRPPSWTWNSPASPHPMTGRVSQREVSIAT